MPGGGTSARGTRRGLSEKKTTGASAYDKKKTRGGQRTFVAARKLAPRFRRLAPSVRPRRLLVRDRTLEADGTNPVGFGGVPGVPGVLGERGEDGAKAFDGPVHARAEGGDVGDLGAADMEEDVGREGEGGKGGEGENEGDALE